MAIDNLMKKVNIFLGKVKAASNIATLIFLIATAYTMSQWHKVSNFDSFLNALIAFVMLIVNIKFYRIHLELESAVELTEEREIQRLYKLQKREYGQWLIASLLLFISFILFISILK